MGSNLNFSIDTYLHIGCLRTVFFLAVDCFIRSECYTKGSFDILFIALEAFLYFLTRKDIFPLIWPLCSPHLAPSPRKHYIASRAPSSYHPLKGLNSCDSRASLKLFLGVFVVRLIIYFIIDVLPFILARTS